MEPKAKMNAATRVSIVTLSINAALTLIKFVVGFAAASGAMVSDAVHSASDVLSTVIVIVGIKASRRAKDADHPYGHDRMESIASLVLSFILFLTGAAIAVEAVTDLWTGNYAGAEMPGVAALAAAILSIAVKEWMYHYTKAVAVREKYASLMADAWHHRSDALSSVGALIGIGGARLGFAAAEPAASGVIAIFIMKAAVDIFRAACDGIVDKSEPEKIEEALRTSALAVDGVERVDMLETRRFGSGYYVDLEISVNGDLPLYEAHAISEAVHDTLEEKFPDIKHCMVHVNPKT